MVKHSYDGLALPWTICHRQLKLIKSILLIYNLMSYDQTVSELNRYTPNSLWSSTQTWPLTRQPTGSREYQVWAVATDLESLAVAMVVTWRPVRPSSPALRAAGESQMEVQQSLESYRPLLQLSIKTSIHQSGQNKVLENVSKLSAPSWERCY